jgi:hypothetical protein
MAITRAFLFTTALWILLAFSICSALNNNNYKMKWEAQSYFEVSEDEEFADNIAFAVAESFTSPASFVHSSLHYVDKMNLGAEKGPSHQMSDKHPIQHMLNHQLATSESTTTICWR